MGWLVGGWFARFTAAVLGQVPENTHISSLISYSSVSLTDCLSVRESWSRPDCSCPATLWVFALITLARREVRLTLVSSSNFHSAFLRVLLQLCCYWFTSTVPSRLINNTYYTLTSPKPFYYTSVIHNLQLICLYKNLRLHDNTCSMCSSNRNSLITYFI